MAKRAKQAGVGLLEQLDVLVRERLPAAQAEPAAVFIRHYFAQVDPGDLREREAGDLLGAALSHWNFMQQRDAGRPKVRVINPRLEENGWQSPHTVVEIVNDDMPFLVDSVTMEVNRQGLTLHLIIHPVLRVERGPSGKLDDLGSGPPAGNPESLMHLEVDRRTDPRVLGDLREGIERVLGDVRRAVEDWQPMQARMRDTIAEVEKANHPPLAGDVHEIRAFLAWALDHHFTFLGCRDHELVEGGDGVQLKIVPGSGFGILRDESEQDVARSFAALPPEIRGLAREPKLLVLTKANARATVHRPGYLDYIGVKRFDQAGHVVGERRFLGLYTHTAYIENPTQIPILRQKIANVARRAAYLPGGHMAKDLQTILESYLRDELFQISEDDLYEFATGILRLGERQRIRLFVRRDRWQRFVACLIYVPREIYNTELRVRFQGVLMAAFNGVSSEFNVQFSESVLARILITVRTPVGAIPEYDAADLEGRLVQASRRWQDALHEALVERFGEERGNTLLVRFGSAFPAGYREDTPARIAVHDLESLEGLSEEQPVRMHLYRPVEAQAGSLRFKIFQSGTPVALTTSLPMLEHMGVKVLEERPYQVEPAGRPAVWIHDFGMSHDGEDLELAAVRDKFHEAFLKVWRGDAENDDFNRLVLRAGLGWREVGLLRAYGRYLRQTGFSLSQGYMEYTLAAHPAIATLLVTLFQARFDPDRRGAPSAAESDLVQRIEAALESVSVLDEDRILRGYLALILGTLRTNFYQTADGGGPKNYLSFKLDSARLPGLPEPRPMYEIFVYSPRFEGVHLRGGKVARGGLRWSDRMEDFRTEVLGLMKAQMVKNAVIVPVGSKGGFVVKAPPPAGDREAALKEGIACYRMFLCGLLDLTDNLVGGKVVPPPNVVRHDGDDPYLVVAADKGTATFSDIANAVARDYGFWLGDAFASGGSAGYDHKKMGITARGAWESAKRHFREMGKDIQTQPFTVAGIGDMSGDVFGNGMLLSRHIRLVAAFDHRHVFLDPDPDPEASFRERERVFALPRSSWADYDSGLISKGGGIWPRTAKSIPLSPEVRRALDVAAERLTPADLIRAILKAPVDMLYNGGIGTYVKAAGESHAQAGDRANDAVRVDGRELRCKVVVEGGNLGLTQLGRIEFGLAGGRINTDAIDNSAGVDCSDHEVNIKILLDAVVGDGELTGKQRNQLLEEMTDEVAELVLRDNYFQNQSLFVTGARGPLLLDAQVRFIRFLEKSGRLNRAIEFLPDEEEIAERRHQGVGLTTPERSVLLAYSKIWVYQELVDSDVPDDPYVSRALERYFPAPLRDRYREQMRHHPLRREIVATHVTNSMMNRVGSTFVHRMQEEAGATPPGVVKAYMATREVFGLVDFWKGVESLDNAVPAAAQARMLIDAGRLVVRGTLWFLREPQQLSDLAGSIASLTPVRATVSRLLRESVGEEGRGALDQEARGLMEQGVPEALAGETASLDLLYATLDIAAIAAASGRTAEQVCRVFFALGGRLSLPRLRRQIGTLPTDTLWQSRARAALRDDLAALQRQLVAGALRDEPALMAAEDVIGHWESRNASRLERIRQVLHDLESGGAPDLAMLSVALRELRVLC